MLLADAPVKIVEAFAEGGSKNTIPVVSSGVPGSASWTLGFPPETRIDPADGGIGPSGLDFNGIYNQMSALIRWANAGAGFSFDAAFAASVGGYPKGAQVLRADNSGYWLSLIDNNTNDPNAGGAGWIPQGSVPVSSVFASGQQTLAAGHSKVIFDTVEFDPPGFWDAANKRFFAPFAGKYRMSGAVLLAAPSGQNFATQIWVNGAIAKQSFEGPQVSDNDMTLPFTAILSVAKGDFIEAFVVSLTAVLAGGVGSNVASVFAQLEYLGQ